jgi:hypothetical protein
MQREQLSYAQQALSQQLQQESGTEMDTLVSGVKNSSNLVKKKDTLISMELEMLLLFCMLKKNMISQRYCKSFK